MSGMSAESATTGNGQPLLQYTAQSAIKDFLFYRKSVRRYAASTLFVFACANAASATSPG